jgi:hypothetical protein
MRIPGRRRDEDVHVHQHLLWGFVATVFLSGILRIAQAMGVTRIDLTLMLGTMFSEDRDHAKVIGFILHFLNGWAFASIYVAAFHSMRRSSALIGGLIGAVHAMFVLSAALPLLPGAHPRMASESDGPEPTSMLQPPGFFAMNYGRRTPIVTVAAHVIYGAILGQFYRVGRTASDDGLRGDLRALTAPES